MNHYEIDGELRELWINNFKALAENQEKLGDEFQQVLNDNLWDLIVFTSNAMESNPDSREVTFKVS